MGKTTSRAGRLILFLVLSALLAGVDQLTKRWALSALGDHEPVVLIDGILWFLRIENTGAAFGIMKGQMTVFYLITAVVTAGIVAVILRMPPEKKYFPLFLCLCFLWAGALGNLIDRTFRKSVVDFIYFVPIDFPVFNVADIFVTCSTAVLMILLLTRYSDEELSFLGLGSRKKAEKAEKEEKEEKEEAE